MGSEGSQVTPPQKNALRDFLKQRAAPTPLHFILLPLTLTTSSDETSG